MKTLAQTSFALAVTLFAFACGGSSSDSGSDPSTPGDEQDITGQKCGGNVANPKSCPSGYDCIVSSSTPDLPGTCKKHSCVQNEICAINSHFDTTKCACVPNTCIQNVICAINSHFDTTTCACVANAPPKGATCLTLTCESGYHCCSGPLTADGVGHASCQPDGSLCPL
jgi:hypothetical protein